MVPGDAPAARFAGTGSADQSLIAQGSLIRGRVERSVLFANVIVEDGAHVTDSIVMSGTWIGPGAQVNRVIVDKSAYIGAGARVGWGADITPNKSCPDHLSTGITLIGKGTRLPENVEIGRNCRIGPGLIESHFPAVLPSGEVVETGQE